MTTSNPSNPAESNPAESSWIVDTTESRFELDVIERSKITPVVVDFWATWCQPCRMLGPALEQLAREYQGKFILVKADTETMPHVAAEFQVQAIPTVFGLVDGQVVDFFQGVLAPSQLRVWIDKIIEAAELIDARAMELTDPAGAEQIYRKRLQQVPNQADAAIGLTRLLVQQQRDEEARQLIAEMEERGFLEPELQKLKAQLDLQVDANVDIAQLQAAAEAEPDNLGRKLELAEALAACKEFEPSLQLCLELVEKDKKGVGEKARQLMVDVFRVLPDDSPLTSDYRRRLASLLY